MPIASQVKSLTEDIEASYGARVAAVSDIIKETEQTLGSFHRTHKKMADDLMDLLSSDNSTRASEVHKMRASNVKELKETAQNLKDTAQKLGQWLSSTDAGRKKEFAHVFGEIKATVGSIEKDTVKMLSAYRSDHKEMATNLKSSLTRDTKDRINHVRNLLSTFVQEHKDSANSLRRELSSFQRSLAKTVREMRSDFGNDHRSARTHWQNLAKVMAAKRAGKPIPSIPRRVPTDTQTGTDWYPAGTPSPRAEMGVPKAVKVEAEEAFVEGELKVRVLEVIRAHPNGITLSEIGKVLKIAYIRAGKPIKDLLIEGRVTKQNSHYFPA